MRHARTHAATTNRCKEKRKREEAKEMKHAFWALVQYLQQVPEEEGGEELRLSLPPPPPYKFNNIDRYLSPLPPPYKFNIYR
jgi:hypothetical protein